MVGRLVLLVIAAACRKDASPPSSPEPRLFTEAEVTAYKGALMARLAETASRRCPRPVVRKPGIDGSATAELETLVVPTGPLATCLEGVHTLAKSGTPMATLVDVRDPRLLELEGRCGPQLEQTVRRAAAAREACSPYQIGIRADPESWLTTFNTAHLLGLRARVSAERGTPAYALGMLLDGVSSYRDLSRGSVGMISAMVAVATTAILLDHARAIATTATLRAGDLDALITGVDALIASQPPFGDTLRAERDYFELHHGMPPLEPPGWAPPGGWFKGGPPARAGKPMTKSPIDEGAITFAAAAKMAAARDRACPPTATLKACHDGLTELAEAASKVDTKEVSAALWNDLAKAAAAGDTVTTAHRIRDTIATTLANVAHPAFSKYTAKVADGLALLAAFRIHLEVLRAGRCPTAAQLDAAPYAALRAPAALGDQLDIAVAADGGLEITAPSWIASKRPPWRVRCNVR